MAFRNHRCYLGKAVNVLDALQYAEYAKAIHACTSWGMIVMSETHWF